MMAGVGGMFEAQVLWLTGWAFPLVSFTNLLVGYVPVFPLLKVALCEAHEGGDFFLKKQLTYWTSVFTPHAPDILAFLCFFGECVKLQNQALIQFHILVLEVPLLVPLEPVWGCTLAEILYSGLSPSSTIESLWDLFPCGWSKEQITD